MPAKVNAASAFPDCNQVMPTDLPMPVPRGLAWRAKAPICRMSAPCRQRRASSWPACQTMSWLPSRFTELMMWGVTRADPAPARYLENWLRERERLERAAAAFVHAALGHQ